MARSQGSGTRSYRLHHTYHQRTEECMPGAQLPFSIYTAHDASQGVTVAIVIAGLPTLAKIIRIIPHRHVQSHRPGESRFCKADGEHYIRRLKNPNTPGPGSVVYVFCACSVQPSGTPLVGPQGFLLRQMVHSQALQPKQTGTGNKSLASNPASSSECQFLLEAVLRIWCTASVYQC